MMAMEEIERAHNAPPTDPTITPSISASGPPTTDISSDADDPTIKALSKSVSEASSIDISSDTDNPTVKTLSILL